MVPGKVLFTHSPNVLLFIVLVLTALRTVPLAKGERAPCTHMHPEPKRGQDEIASTKGAPQSGAWNQQLGLSRNNWTIVLKKKPILFSYFIQKQN